MKKSSEKEKSNILGKQTIAQGAMVISFFTVLSGLLGLFRDRLLASKFLVSKIGDVHQSLDVYYTAFFIPDTLYYLIFLGALAAAFIPVFTSYISKKEEKEGFYIANSFLNLALLFIIAISLIILIIAPYLVKIIAPGFSEEKQKLVASLIRLMLISPIFFGVSNTMGGILNSYKRFTLFAIAPCLYNLGIILGTVLFYQKWAIYAPAIGVLIGAFLHMATQIYGAYSLGYRWQPVVDFKHQAVKKIFRLMLPRMAALAVERINRWVFVAIASTLAVGSVSIINLASNLQSFPVSFFGVAVATATFPFLAEAASLNKKIDFGQNFVSGLRYIFYLMIPASVLIILLRAQIVRIILGAGNFGWADTRLTAAVLGLFAISLFAQGVTPLLCRSFYALSDTSTPFKLSLWTIATNALGSFLLTRQSFIQPLFEILKVKNSFDARIIGLPIAFSISSILYMALLYYYLMKKIGYLDKNLQKALWQIVIASIVMGAFVQGFKFILGSFINLKQGINVVIQASVAGFLGLMIYLIITYLMKLNEAQKIVNKIKSFKKRWKAESVTL